MHERWHHEKAEAEYEAARVRFTVAVSSTVYREAEILDAMAGFLQRGGTPGALRLLTAALTPEALRGEG